MAAQHPSPQNELSRRSWLKVGSALGLSTFNLANLRADQSDKATARLFGNAKSCVVVFLFGGPGQQDVWDPKPDAPQEARGEFKPISSSVPGTILSEQIPRLSQEAHRYTIVRSMSHRDFEHGSASYTALTGHPHPKPGTNTPATKDDFPTYGAVVTKERPTTRPVPSAVTLGPVMHQGNRPPMAGQNAGFLGSGYEPFRVAADPAKTDFKVEGLGTPKDLPPNRVRERFNLLTQLEPGWTATDEIRGMSSLKYRASGLLADDSSRVAFEISKETQKTRDHYGKHRFGQTMLLARRLVEAEVPLITINWSRSNADQWDTHAKNYPRMKKLLPPFDLGMAAFLSDLDSRGLLDSTLVLCLGEFGRTPKINKDAGRDHWPDCYSLLIAGGGIARGQVFGASDAFAAYPFDDPIAPWDISATCYHLMGIPPAQHIHDRLGRPFPIAPGRVESGLFG